MIGITSRGDFSKTQSFLNKMRRGDIFSTLDHYGQMGVNALAKATPVDTGLTAASWKYRIVRDKGRVSIQWYNTHTVSGVQVAILIQYGHGTGTGGYVAGRDYINPAMQPLFDQIADDVWKKVTNG